MRRLVEWLIAVETMAEAFYWEAYNFFREDLSMSHFPKKCGEGEALHAQLMVRAAESLKSEGSEPTGVLELDHGLCERIEKRFLESRGDWQPVRLNKTMYFSASSLQSSQSGMICLSMS